MKKLVLIPALFAVGALCLAENKAENQATPATGNACSTPVPAAVGNACSIKSKSCPTSMGRSRLMMGNPEDAARFQANFKRDRAKAYRNRAQSLMDAKLQLGETQASPEFRDAAQKLLDTGKLLAVKYNAMADAEEKNDAATLKTLEREKCALESEMESLRAEKEVARFSGDVNKLVEKYPDLAGVKELKAQLATTKTEYVQSIRQAKEAEARRRQARDDFQSLVRRLCELKQQACKSGAPAIDKTPKK